MDVLSGLQEQYHLERLIFGIGISSQYYLVTAVLWLSNIDHKLI